MQIVNDDNFDKEVLDQDGTVLVYFSAPWCAPCKRQAPIVEDIANSGKVKVFKVDIDESPEITREFRIRGIPALVLIKNGKEVSNKSGLLSLEQLSAFVSQ